jgi:carbohydrate binding protein with CBM6 domain/phospholipase D-like protein
MENGFSYMENGALRSMRARRRAMRAAMAVITGFVLASSGASPAFAQEQILFPAKDNAIQPLLQKIRDEQVRVDIGVWLLGEHELSINIVNKHLAGVPVRVLGDRASIFENSPETRREFEFLANAGVPIRLRYNPTWFPEIIHWKAGIFVGQNTVEFGSANWTTFELAPVSSTNFKDETAMFTNDSTIVDAFKTEFDRMWADTTYFKDWPEAYQLETGVKWNTAMNINRARLEPERNTNIPGMVWAQGSALIDAMTAAVQSETQGVDIVIYRLTVPKLTDALIQKKQAGVPVRVMVEPTQYRNPGFPEYWLTGNNVDRLWAAGISIKQRVHEGLTHMKTLITSASAMNGSSNFTKNYERDHNYFVNAQNKPLIYFAIKDRFQAMWDDAANYTEFTPQQPAAAQLMSPASGTANTSTAPKLEWQRAPWVVFYDVFMGTSPSSMTQVARVNAVETEEPPQTYSFTPTALQPSATYFWRVVGRTYASAIDNSIASFSEIWSFSTGGGGGGGNSGPFGGTPRALPGTIQAEEFDLGASGVAYVDTTAGNIGGSFRNTDVDITTTGDAGGGFILGWVNANEWLKYSVNVASAGSYDIQVRVASAGQGGIFHIEVDGVNKTGPMTVPSTGGWDTWMNVVKTGVSLAAGPQVWKVVMDSDGPTAYVGNINSINVVTASSGGGNSAPFGGTPRALPGTIQAEEFDQGASGVAYLDTTAGNIGGSFRNTDVDITTTGDGGGGFILGWNNRGEWLKYTVNVASAGSYDIQVRVASLGQGGTFHIEVNDQDKTGPITVPNTGGWDTWMNVGKTGVSLAAGTQVWKLVMDSDGPTAYVGNINLITVTAAGGPPPPPPPPPAPEIVIYAADVSPGNLIGNWARVNDASAAAGVKIASSDVDPNVQSPSATPPNYFDITFNVQAGVRYRLWLRMSALNANKFNDSVYVQFSGSVNATNTPIYRIGTPQALNVNMATCGDCPPTGWGWQNHAYWETDTGEVRFAASGPQTMRIQIREDGVAIDQFVLSPTAYVNNPPGTPTNDSTIVRKP